MSATEQTVSFFWFRRDLRLEDNVGLTAALQSGRKVVPLFIFDDEILSELDPEDARVTFIYQRLEAIHNELKKYGSGLLCLKGKPLDIWKQLLDRFNIEAVYTNRDYEPYARRRDRDVFDLLKESGIVMHTFKDQVIFEIDEVLKADGAPYTVFTPYRNAWMRLFVQPAPLPVVNFDNFLQQDIAFPKLGEIGFQTSTIRVPDFTLEHLDEYALVRDYPALDQTSHLSTHLRFGTVSVRDIIRGLRREHKSFMNELIWREFFMQILYHFPKVVQSSFRPKYDAIRWRNNEEEFKRWCNGTTGYPMVDAGMRELNKTGLMHNRVRMVTASFLCKHLLIDWRWGEAYFAQKLLDYDLSANNGNWQWAAGTGCDAAPYFRVFNPTEQQKKFDPDMVYIRKWIPEWGTPNYPEPMVEHRFARQRALDTYAAAVK